MVGNMESEFRCTCGLSGSIVCDDHDDDDAELSLLADISQESVAGRMVSTPLQDHAAAMDISDGISSIHGNILCICCIALILFHSNVVFTVLLISFGMKLLFIFSKVNVAVLVFLVSYVFK